MTLFIKDLVSIGAVDNGDNPDAEIVFWKRRKAKGQPEQGATESNRMIEGIDLTGVPEATAEALTTAFEVLKAERDAALEAVPAPTVEVEVEKALPDDVAELIAKATQEADIAKAELAVEVAKRRDAELVMKIRDDKLEPLLGAADEIAPNLRKLQEGAPEAFDAIYTNLMAAAQRLDLSDVLKEIGSNPGEADNSYEGQRDAYVNKRVAELKQPASPDLIIKLRSEFAMTNPNAGRE